MVGAMRDMPFDFEVPIRFFEKADAPPGQSRRVGGVVSTEHPDRQGETVLARALDFSPFLESGWLNDNHSKKTAEGILGYPETVKQFAKGETLPDGKVAKKPGHWVEGYLLENWEPADKIWELGKALQKTNRRLGFSVEGTIHRRIGPKTVFKKSADGKSGKWVGSTVAKATVRNVAVTNCPVNTATKLEILSKSIEALEAAEPDDLEARIAMLEKAMTMGPPSVTPPEGPVTGEGAAAVHAKESLEQDDDDEEKKKKRKALRENLDKSLTYDEATAWVQKRYPGMSPAQIGKFVELTRALKTKGRL
jgi:hypothetical protein